ncbi:MAG: carboxypeptidase regulatory-like domain-containing protein [Terracidiphilus sp.]
MTNKIQTIDFLIDSECARPFRQWGGIACCLFLTLIGLFASTPMLAQYDSSQINGTVHDQSGALIPNATVQIKNRDTGLVRDTITNSTGIYVLSHIPPGVYTVTASSAGFSSASRAGVELVVSQSATLDFSLKPGSSTETVSVSAQTVTLDTSSSSVGETLESDSVNELPLAGRNYTVLMTLQTGVTPINNDQTGGRTNEIGGAVYPSIQGQNNRSNVYLLDGVNNNEAVSGSEIITPIPDDIQEMKVLTHTDSAQFGEGLGGTINVITKSGTNQFHGGAWEFWRGSQFFDATSDPSGVLQALHQNQFGADAGGPVLLPHYNGRDRTFVYGSYEGFRQDIGAVTLQLVPTAAEYTGDFGALLANGIQLYNPFTANRDPFPSNQIPANMIDQNMVKLAQTLFPAPSGSYEGGVFNYENTTPHTHTSNQYDVRGDEYLTKKDLVWAHFLHQNNPIESYGGFPKLGSTVSFIAHNFGAQWIHTFGPSSILTVGVGQNIGTQSTNILYSGDGNSIATAAGFAPSFACEYPHGRSGCLIPALGLGSYIGGGEASETAGGLSGIWEYKADFERTFGRHTLYVGGNIDTNNLGRTAGGNSGLTFSPFQTSNGSTGGNELASFLLSVPEGASRINTDYWETGGWVYGFYGQDQWKIRDNLTINVGLRYDYSTIPVTNNIAGDYYDIFDFNTGVDIIQKMPPACSTTQFAPCMPGGTLPAHVVVSSQPGKLFFGDKSNIQPRIGISYSFRPNTVVHGGYGRTYDNWAAIEQSAQNEDSWLMQTSVLVANQNSQPGLTSSTVVTAENPLVNFGGNYPAPTPFSSIGWATPPQFKNAYSDQWTFGVQQKVSSAGVWTINYVGSRGRNLDYCPVANTATSAGPGAVSPRTPFPYMPQSFFDQPKGQLDYNALETSFQGRSRVTGLTYLVSYTWSKGLNYGTDGWYGIGTTSIENPYNFKADRSVTGYDLPQVFTAGWVWAVPIGKGGFSTGNRISDYVLGNWQINGIATLESGRPYTVQDEGDIANTGNFNFVGSGYERPNQVGNPKPQNQTPSQWINPTAFVAPAQYTFGNTPRNSLRTEPFKNLDASLFREFPVFESMKLQLRLDSFNSFNHPVWGTPNACENCANFGVVTSTVNNARQLQLSGKIVF